MRVRQSLVQRYACQEQVHLAVAEVDLDKPNQPYQGMGLKAYL